MAMWNRLASINSYFLKVRYVKFIGSFLLIHLTFSLSFSILVYQLTGRSVAEGSIKFDSKYEEVLITIIAAPVFETLIFQYGIINFIRKHTKKDILAILISASIFAIGHRYNPFYVFNAFVGGLLLGYSYVLAIYRSSWPFWSACIIHMLYNTAVFALKLSAGNT